MTSLQTRVDIVIRCAEHQYDDIPNGPDREAFWLMVQNRINYRCKMVELQSGGVSDDFGQGAGVPPDAGGTG